MVPRSELIGQPLCLLLTGTDEAGEPEWFVVPGTVIERDGGLHLDRAGRGPLLELRDEWLPRIRPAHSELVETLQGASYVLQLSVGRAEDEPEHERFLTTGLRLPRESSGGDQPAIPVLPAHGGVDEGQRSMLETTAKLFANGELLVRAMGHWPSFHDANVKEVRRDADSCVVVLHVFEMTDEVDASGFLVLKNHHLVTIRMSGIVECTLPENYESDCLFGLVAVHDHDFVRVMFDSAIGREFDWHVLCRVAEMVAVVACDEKGKPFA